MSPLPTTVHHVVFRKVTPLKIALKQGRRELQKSGGQEPKKYPKIDPQKQKNCILLHFYIMILKSQEGQLTPLTPQSLVSGT